MKQEFVFLQSHSLSSPACSFALRHFLVSKPQTGRLAIPAPLFLLVHLWSKLTRKTARAPATHARARIHTHLPQSRSRRDLSNSGCLIFKVTKWFEPHRCVSGSLLGVEVCLPVESVSSGSTYTQSGLIENVNLNGVGGMELRHTGAPPPLSSSAPERRWVGTPRAQGGACTNWTLPGFLLKTGL